VIGFSRGCAPSRDAERKKVVEIARVTSLLSSRGRAGMQ